MLDVKINLGKCDIPHDKHRDYATYSNLRAERKKMTSIQDRLQGMILVLQMWFLG